MITMYEQMANALVFAIYAYVIAGMVFAVAFVSVGVARLDHEARESGPMFRIIIFPGSVALWPVLLTRWVIGRSEAPTQKDPHR